VKRGLASAWRSLAGERPGVREAFEAEAELVSPVSEARVSALDLVSNIRIAGPDLATGQHRGSQALRWILIGLDAAALVASWIPFELSPNHGMIRSRISAGLALLLAMAVSTVASLWFASVRKLYRSRVCSVRAHERSLLVWVAIASPLVGWVTLRLIGSQPHPGFLVLDALAALLLLVFERSAYRAWLGEQRARGRYSRPTIVVGTNSEALYWCRLFRDHPEFGTKVVGVVGERHPGIAETGVRWLGSHTAIVDVARAEGVTSAMVVGTAFSAPTLKRVSRELMAANLHVQISMGLLGLSQGRMTTTEISREVVIYLEPRTLSDVALVLKRTADVVMAVIGLVVLSPLFAVCAVAIHRHDGGPVLFRQQRVGRGGKPFTFYKLRTMDVDAESRRHEIAARNVRQGPLFKVVDDPRVTPVGRFLRLSSIDELPQLLNVLQGHMSIVGPRPALPEEVARFDPELLARHDVRPGITGLWQLEARDGASFESYQRLDLHYVENWSITLDIAIVISTCASVIARVFRRMGTTPP
jgi:exopolysaccharide biosynthesis polyprenyl glycosylphosphotransferase